MRRGLMLVLLAVIGYAPLMTGCSKDKDPEPAAGTVPDIPPGRGATPGAGGPAAGAPEKPPE